MSDIRQQLFGILETHSFAPGIMLAAIEGLLQLAETQGAALDTSLLSLEQLKEKAKELADLVEASTRRKAGSLRFEGEDDESNDYVLDGRSAWITVGALTVYVRRSDELAVGDGERGVSVEILPTGNEADDPPLGSIEVKFDAARCPHCEQFCYQNGGEGCDGYQASGLEVDAPIYG